MPYYTKYTITVKEADSFLIETLRACSTGAMYAVYSNGESHGKNSWDEHEKDLKEFSSKHPDALFLLEGVGEEHPDIWRKYFKNGKMQVCQGVVTFAGYQYGHLK